MNIDDVEKLRIKARNIIIIGIISSIVLALVLLIISPFVSIPVLVVGIIITIIISVIPSKKFTLAYKEVFVLKALESVFTDLVYEPENGLDESVLRDTKMIDMGDHYHSNDYVSGKYKNIRVEQADVEIEEDRTDSEGHTETYTLFQGRWMIFDFNKTFKANMQVREKSFINSQISNWGNKTKYQKIKLEDQDFNKKFVVYAQDDHEAFYILTPHMMDKIKKISNSINGSLLFCFIDNKLHVGLENNKDSFEHGIFSKIDEEKELENISRDIKIITDFVDQLNLDNDLFKMEV